MTKSKKSTTGGKAQPQGGPPRRATKSNVQSSASRLEGRASFVPEMPHAGPDHPRESCFRACQAEPWTCEASCKKMGLDLAACRNPEGSRPSVVRRDIIPFAAAASSGGNLQFRIRPMLEALVEPVNGTVDGSAAPAAANPMTVFVEHPDITQITAAASSYRVIGMGLRVETTESSMNNEGVLSAATEYPVPGTGYEHHPNDFETYLLGIPGNYSRPSKEGLVANVPITGSDFIVADLNSDYTVSRIDMQAWRAVTQNAGIILGANGPWFGDCMGAVPVSVTGMAASASLKLTLCLVWEYTPKSRYAPSKPPVAPAYAVPASVSPKALEARHHHHRHKNNDIGHVLSRVAKSVPSVLDGVSEAAELAGRVPILADGAAIVKDVADVAETIWDIGSSFF